VAAGQVHAAAAVAQLRLHCLDDEAEALFAAHELLGRGFRFAGRRGGQG
jgi:hypothetical protein